MADTALMSAAVEPTPRPTPSQEPPPSISPVYSSADEGQQPACEQQHPSEPPPAAAAAAATQQQQQEEGIEEPVVGAVEVPEEDDFSDESARRRFLRLEGGRVGVKWPMLLGCWNAYMLGNAMLSASVLGFLVLLDAREVTWAAWSALVVTIVGAVLGIVSAYVLSEGQSPSGTATLLCAQGVANAFFVPLAVVTLRVISLVQYSKEVVLPESTVVMAIPELYAVAGIVVWTFISYKAMRLAGPLLRHEDPSLYSPVLGVVVQVAS